ncbi:uncharacterized protein QYS62_005619 [Fusarium acuminatum]|uniref:Uncharacterized protein n=1 Tax=Fusarium acuminatum TaxID=5515 RepID=A0ABZ2WWK6_9HYPO
MFRPAAAATLQTGEKAKMFWKRPNESEGVYYVVNKKQHYPKRPKESEYFRINDLLLDLDDMFSKTWLQKQTQLSESEQISKTPRSLPLQLSAALKNQDSITSMRRLVSQFLSSDPSSISWLSTNDISSDIRDACETLCKPDVLQTSYDLLVFLGNLGQRLLARGSHIGGPLCGFGLRLSAAICKPSVTRKYLSIGSESGYWTGCEQGLRDIHDSLETYLRHFSTTSSSTSLGLLDRQGLLKLLIGDADQGSTSLQESFRSLIISYVRIQGESKQGTMQTALSAYRTYIVLLGHLGARALLLYEKRASATIKNLINEKQGEAEGQAEAIVTEALQTADDISVVAPTHDAVSTNLNLADCAMLDLEAIEKQGHPQR